MNMVQKEENWMSYKLKDRETSKGVWSCVSCCFSNSKGRVSGMKLSLMVKNGSMINLNA